MSPALLSPSILPARARAAGLLLLAAVCGLGALATACHRQADPGAGASAPGTTADAPATSPQTQAVLDAIARYDAISQQGTPADKCTQAARVVQAQAQAHDQYALAEWKAKQAADCAALPPAGLADT